MTRLPLADSFQAVSDPTRLRIFALLSRMELSVGELAQLLDQSQPRVSRHVRILSDAGIVDRRKEGSWVFLAISDARRTAPLVKLIEAWTDSRSESVFERDSELLDAVRADRAEAAERYFTAHAQMWDSIRSLHVAEAEVERAMENALGDRKFETLVDIGTGTGRMIELFGGRAGEAIGIDRSSEMLRLARVKLESVGVRSSLRQGDMYALPIAGESADCVIIHQVLHYAHAPADAIAEASRVLSPGGILLVADFAAHDREELRSQDSHLRLGFADEVMTGWFEAAGLKVDRIEHLEGGALTVTLWRGTRPADGYPAGGVQRSESSPRPQSKRPESKRKAA